MLSVHMNWLQEVSLVKILVCSSRLFFHYEQIKVSSVIPSQIPTGTQSKAEGAFEQGKRPSHIHVCRKGSSYSLCEQVWKICLFFDTTVCLEIYLFSLLTSLIDMLILSVKIYLFFDTIICLEICSFFDTTVCLIPYLFSLLNNLIDILILWVKIYLFFDTTIFKKLLILWYNRLFEDLLILLVNQW